MTEELETGREELQSVNEEMITVNAELQLKIEESSRVTDDLQNLIESGEIGTVFVNRSLSVQRFTPKAATVFNLLPTDIGRPLEHITHRLDYAHLAEDVQEVFNSLKRIEREARTQDGRWFLVRLLPYRTSEDHIGGAVISLVDVTARRQAEEALRKSEQRMRVWSCRACATTPSSRWTRPASSQAGAPAPNVSSAMRRRKPSASRSA